MLRSFVTGVVCISPSLDIHACVSPSRFTAKGAKKGAKTRTLRLIPQLNSKQAITNLGNGPLRGVNGIGKLVTATVETNHDAATVLARECQEPRPVRQVHGRIARVRHAVHHIRGRRRVVQGAVLRRPADPDRGPLARQLAPVGEAALRRRHVGEVRREGEELEAIVFFKE